MRVQSEIIEWDHVYSYSWMFFKDLFAFPQLDKQGEEKSNWKKIIVFCYKKEGNKWYIKI